MQLGILGLIGLALARFYTFFFSRPSSPALGELDPTLPGEEVWRALAPAILGTELSSDDWLKLKSRLKLQMNALPIEALAQLQELLAFMQMSAARWLLFSVPTAWPDASVKELSQALEKWRRGRWALLRSTYASLGEMLKAARYGYQDVWAEIAYPGPPKL